MTNQNCFRPGFVLAFTHKTWIRRCITNVEYFESGTFLCVNGFLNNPHTLDRFSVIKSVDVAYLSGDKTF